MNKTIKYFEDLITHLNLDHGNINSIEHFDDRKFRFGVYLVNQDNRAVKIRKGSIDELVITDDLTEWFHHGHLTFLNPDDVLERAQTRIQNDGENLNATIKTLPYRFRGDGRDLLYIHMEPYIQDDDQPFFENQILKCSDFSNDEGYGFILVKNKSEDGNYSEKV